jgi:hypothetical protein
MHFYSMLFSQAWTICEAWVASYSLVSKIVFGVLFAGAALVLESLLWPMGSEMLRRIARLIIGAIVGPIAVVGVMFVICLFYYAPSAVLGNVANDAAKTAQAETAQSCRAERIEVSRLKEQIRSDPYASKLIQVERERDSARTNAADANNFAERMVRASDDLTKAEQEFEEAIDRQYETYTAFVQMLADPTLKPGITVNDAMTQHQQYLNFKSAAALAKSKVHEKAEALQVIELDR